MVGTLKKMIAFLLILTLFTGAMPMDGLVERLALRQTAAAAEEERSSRAKEAADSQEQRFAAVADEAAEKASAGEIADEGEWQYVLLPEYNYAVIVGHLNQGNIRINLPDTLGGADVVAILSGTFNDHPELQEVTFSANIYYADAGALPRGVGVRGYHGTYAQYWAERNRRAFENLSELDFVTGVADLSAVSPEHVQRLSATQVRMRELEASWLKVGSVFFWPDPDNVYTISYYRVTGIAREGDMVLLDCETPEMSDFLNSYHVENVPMMPDASADVEDGTARKAGAGGGGGFNKTFTPNFKLGKATIQGTLGYSNQTTFSCDYSNLVMNSYTKTTTEGWSGSLSVEVDGEAKKKNFQEVEILNPSWREEKESKFYLGQAVVFTAWGIVSLELELHFVAKVSVSGEISWTSKTVTTERFTGSNHRLTSESSKKEDTFSTSITGQLKVGFSFTAKLLLGPIDIASVSLFAGLKLKAEAEFEEDLVMDPWQAEVAHVWHSEPGSDVRNAAMEALNLDLKAGQMSINDLNMTDCIKLTVSFVLEGSVVVGNDWVTFWTGELNLLDWEIWKGHIHIWPYKFIYEPGDAEEPLRIAQKEGVSETFHTAELCPLSDQIYLMVPQLNNSDDISEAYGTLSLMGRTTLTAEEAPQLDLEPYGYRVTGWYLDRKLSKPVPYPLSVKSGDHLYAEVVEVLPVHLVDYAGNPLKDEDGEEIQRYLANAEYLKTEDLSLQNRDHLVGWYKVNNATSLNILYPNQPAEDPDLIINGDKTEQTWMAVFDNDLTLRFFDGQTQLGEDIPWGHNLTFPVDRVPIAGTWDDEDSDHHGTYTYTWSRRRLGDGDNNAVTFPYAFRDRYPVVELKTRSVTMQHTDDVDYGVSKNIIGDPAVTVSYNQLYDDDSDFVFGGNSTQAWVTGFRTNRTRVNDDGTTENYTVDPQAISIPSMHDGKPVVGVYGNIFKDLPNLKYVKLPSTITWLYNNVFYGCKSLVKLDLSACTQLTALPARGFATGDTSLRCALLPDGLTSIGEEAFSGCTSISKATINATIGSKAFQGCTALVQVQLGRGVQTIGNQNAIGVYAFDGCSALTSLTVPCTATKVGDYFIRGCTSLTTLTFDGGPTEIWPATMFIGENSHLRELTLNKGVCKINGSAFSNDKYGNPFLTDITLPKAPITTSGNILAGTAVERLYIYDLCSGGSSVAINCTTLESVTFENGTIVESSFSGCTNLKTVTMGRGVTAIGRNAFQGCTSLVTITLGENVLDIGNNAFRGCTLLEEIHFGGQEEWIGNDVFDDCTSLRELDLPATVTTMGSSIITNCIALQKLTVGGENCPVLTGTLNVGNNKSVLNEIIVREGVTTLSGSCFSGYPKLTKVTLPETLTEIGDNTFINDAALVTINIPAGVKTIGKSAFQNCAVMEPTFAENPQLEILGNYAFAGCKAMTAIPLGSKLREVGNNAFANCTALEELDFPATVESYGYSCIGGCTSLLKLSLGGPACPVLTVPFNIDVLSPLANIEIREGVTEIGENVFYNYSVHGYNVVQYGFLYLTEVTLPQTLKKIGDCAFYNANRLRSINIPSTVTQIGDDAFNGCGNLTPELPEMLNWTSVGARAFRTCSGLTKLVFSDQLVSIGNGAFQGCTGLRNITLREGLLSVGDNAFEGCSGLEEIVFPESVRTFGEYMLSGCTGIRKLTVGGSGCAELSGSTWFTMGSGSVLTELVIRDGVTRIGDYAFDNGVWRPGSVRESWGYSSLTSVYLPGSLESIGLRGFYCSRSLPSIRIPDSVIITLANKTRQI